MRRKVVSNTRTIGFPTYFTASFLMRFSSGKPTQAHSSGFSYQTKIYRTCAIKCPYAPCFPFLVMLNKKCQKITSFRAHCCILAVGFIAVSILYALYTFATVECWMKPYSQSSKFSPQDYQARERKIRCYRV